MWNFSSDTVYEQEIKLAEKYDSITYINCLGRLEENRVQLSDILPYFTIREVVLAL